MGAAAAVIGVSAMTTASSTYSKVVEKKLEGEFARQDAEINSAWAKLRARGAEARGEALVKEARVKTRKLIGAQRAAFAAQNIAVETGTALDVQLESAELGAMDVMTIRNNTWREAFGIQTQDLNYIIRGERAGLASSAAIRQTIATGGATFARDVAYASSFMGSGSRTGRTPSGGRSRLDLYPGPGGP